MYRTIDSAFWTDPKIRKLSADAKLLLLYFITNAHTHVSGIYYAPRLLIQHETGLTGKAIDTLCDTLSKLELCRFDRALELVWVKNMMRYQGRGDKNLKSAAHHVTEDLHYSPLIADFLEYYPEVKAVIPDRVLDRVSRVRTPEQDSRSLIPDQDTIAHFSKTKNERTHAPHFSDDFIKFWDAYPRKIGKQAAWKTWNKLNGGRPEVAVIVHAVEVQKTCTQWCESVQYIPHPSTWLNRGQWDDQIENGVCRRRSTNPDLYVAPIDEWDRIADKANAPAKAWLEARNK